MLDITVCILSYNRPTYLREALQSVLFQTKQPKRIAIYDNGSDQPTYDSVKEFLGEHVQWVGSDINHSAIWNFCRAMQDCDTEYIALFHDDDRMCSGFLEAQIGLLEDHPEAIATSSNGYLIDENGNRSGKTLEFFKEGASFELYQCSGQVALKYANSSCVPLSPAIYRCKLARSVAFREGFGKVSDAVYFCDLAEIGAIVYQIKPLYECRFHSGQDSSYFPYDQMNLLEDFFWSRNCFDKSEQNRLHKMLSKQHAARNIRQIAWAIKKMKFLDVLYLLLDKRFKFINAVLVLGAYGFRVIRESIKK